MKKKNCMKKLILISALLLVIKGCASNPQDNNSQKFMIYEGNNFEECKAIASIMTQNDSDYKESMKTCNSLLHPAQHQHPQLPKFRGREMDNRSHSENVKEVNKPSCRPPNC